MSDDGPPTDGAGVKALLQSEDIGHLQTVAQQYAALADTDENNQQEALCKLQIMVWNRVLQLQKTNNVDNSEMIQSLHVVSKLWLEMGEHERGLAQLQRALELQADNPTTLQCMADQHLAAKNYTAAIDHHQKAIALFEKDKDTNKGAAALGAAHCELAHVYEAQAEFETAKTSLQTAQSVLEGASDSAAKEIQQALGLALLQQGELQYKLGDYEDAVSTLTMASAKINDTLGHEDDRAKECVYLLQMAKDLA